MRDGDLPDLLGELRVLLPGAQTLTAFLIILPFNSRFAEIRDGERVVYVITFLCSVLSLIFFTAPAAHHRLQRPLRDREGFKELATRLIVAGLVPLSVAIVLATQLVLSEVVPWRWFAWLVAAIVALAILSLWWILPKFRRFN
jgi:O-antigen/teichoic acid export membrane protein